MTLTVIGAGFGRTGTMTLKLALEQLGFGPCSHMTEALAHPELMAHWVRVVEGERLDWDEVFQNYFSAVDWPACDYWRELATVYPKAKVILTVRDPERWYQSTQNTIFGPTNAELITRTPGLARISQSIADRTFGGTLTDRARLITTFERHNREVVEALPHERLLVYRVAEGWQPLCRFLDVAVPETAFPFVNTTDEFRAYARGKSGPNRSTLSV